MSCRLAWRGDHTGSAVKLAPRGWPDKRIIPAVKFEESDSKSAWNDGGSIAPDAHPLRQDEGAAVFMADRGFDLEHVADQRVGNGLGGGALGMDRAA